MTSPVQTTLRLAVLGLCLLAAAAADAWARRPEIIAPLVPLQTLPTTVGAWSGLEAPAFAPEVVAELGVDEYVNRIYLAGSNPVSLYVGYYRSQQTGDTIHSPQNCLPGAGWLPVSTSRLTLRVDGRSEPVTINSLLIQKGVERQVVLYWYQSHGRVVASEYWSKAYLVLDAIRWHRSDAAMVRVISPVLATDGSEREAEERAAAFVREIFPHLDRLLPA